MAIQCQLNMAKNPTIEELKEFAVSIGLPPIAEQPEYPGWGNYLHEIGHWAVKPHGYIRRYLEFQKTQNNFLPGACKSEPGYQFISWKGIDIWLPIGATPAHWFLRLEKPSEWERHTSKSLPSESFPMFFDPTPTEWGVQEWCRQVLAHFRWDCSPNCPGKKSNSMFWEIPEQDINLFWQSKFGRKPPESEQLKWLGFDIPNGKFRPSMTDVYVDGFELILEFEDRPTERVKMLQMAFPN